MNKTDQHHWKHLSSERGPQLRLFDVRFDMVENPLNGKKIKATILEAYDAANVVAITRNEQVVLVRQYRFGTRETCLELPGGMIEPHEAMEVGVRRELLEETGFTAPDWHYLGFTYANPVFMNNKIHHWVARNAEKTAETIFDDGEYITTEVHPIYDVKTMLNTGVIKHPHAIAAFARFFQF